MAIARDIIANILRVDHAGEYGAIRIYQTQRWLARWRAPELVGFLDHSLSDEKQHRDAFLRLMRARRVRPCRSLAVWGVGGWCLGICTGLLGRAAILICTEAVERAVHRHLEDQVRWLAGHDLEIAHTIAAIQVQELEHLTFAQDHGATLRPAGLRALDRTITAATEVLIWCSTYGASSRMVREIARRPASSEHQTTHSASPPERRPETRNGL